MDAGRTKRRHIDWRLTHWELLIVSLMFVAIYVTRETGAFGSAALRVLDDVFIAVALLVVLRAAHVRRGHAIAHLVVAGTSIVVAVVDTMVSNEELYRLSIGLSAYLVIVVAALTLGLVVRQRHVSVDTIFGALSVYLAVGVAFGMVFTAVARTNPGAFEPAQFVIDGESSLYYFSFVTLTSLGYGDIAPVADGLRILATIETIIGALLLAAVVGWVVGLLVAVRTESDADRRLDTIVAALERLSDRQG